MKAIRRRQWEIQCGNGEQTADSWMWTGFTKSCPDLEDYNWDNSGHQMGDEIHQRGGLRWGARGHIERTGMCNDNNRSLLPGLSVLEWNCCVCEFALSGPLFLQILYVPFVGCNLQPGQRLRFSSKQQNLDSCLSQTVASTHTQAAEPRTDRGHEGLWTRREDGL